MLEQLKRFADKLRVFKTPALLLSLLTLLALAWIVINSSSQGDDIYLIPVLVLFIWSLLAFSFLSLFAHIPQHAEDKSSKLDKIITGLKRGFYYLFAIALILVTNALILTSVQLFGAWLRMY